MTRSMASIVGCTAILAAIWGCRVASAADGSSSSSAALAASAQTPPSFPADSPPPPHKLPQAAFDACKSLSEGDACSVSFRGQTLTGTCRKGPNGESELACVPAYPPGPPPSESNETLTDSAMERKLDQLEREIHGS